MSGDAVTGSVICYGMGVAVEVWLGSSKLKMSGPQLQNPHLEVKAPKGTDNLVLTWHYILIDM